MTDSAAEIRVLHDLDRLAQQLAEGGWSDGSAIAREGANTVRRLQERREELLRLVEGLRMERESAEQGIVNAMASGSQWREATEKLAAAARAVTSDEELAAVARRYELLCALRAALPPRSAASQ